MEVRQSKSKIIQQSTLNNMTPEEISKCKKNGVVWIAKGDKPEPHCRRRGSTFWRGFLEDPDAHATRAAAQAAIDERVAKRKSVESHETPISETQADPEPAKWAERLDGETVQDGDDIYTGMSSIDLQAPSVSPACGSQNINWEKAIALKGHRVGDILFAGHKIMARYLTPEWKAWKERQDAKAKPETPACPQEADGWTQEEIDKAAFRGRTFQTGAKRDTDVGKPRMDLIPPELLIALGNVFRDGAAHYGEHNWEKGIPLNQHIASLMRHVVAVMQGDHSENHDEKMAANVAMFIATARRIESGKLPRELDTIGWCK